MSKITIRHLVGFWVIYYLCLMFFDYSMRRPRVDYEMKRTIKDWIIVFASLLDDAVIVLLVLLVLWFLRIPISLPVIIFLVLFFIVTVFLMHRFIIPALHKKIRTGSEGMIGLKGEVMEPLEPEGVIQVSSEYWKAISTDENIAVGEQVEIIGVEGLILEVKHKTQ